MLPLAVVSREASLTVVLITADSQLLGMRDIEGFYDNLSHPRNSLDRRTLKRVFHIVMGMLNCSSSCS